MIIVDSREPSEIAQLIKSKKVKVETDFLEVGDYLLPNGVAIERKKGRDMMSSIMSGRLFEQLNNMYNYDQPILCIISENIWKDFYFSKGRYVHKSYMGTLSTLTAKYPKLKVEFLETDEMFVSYLVSLHKKLTEGGANERPAPMKRKAKTIKTRMENTLTCIEGVGIPMSKKLLRKYGSIYNLASVSEKDLQKIDKVGPKLAKNIKETLSGTYVKKREKK